MLQNQADSIRLELRCVIWPFHRLAHRTPPFLIESYHGVRFN